LVGGGGWWFAGGDGGATTTATDVCRAEHFCPVTVPTINLCATACVNLRPFVVRFCFVCGSEPNPHFGHNFAITE